MVNSESRARATLWGSDSDYSTSSGSSHGDVTMYDVIIVTYEVDKYVHVQVFNSEGRVHIVQL